VANCGQTWTFGGELTIVIFMSLISNDHIPVYKLNV